MKELDRRVFTDTKTGAIVTMILASRDWHKDGWWMEHWIPEAQFNGQFPGQDTINEQNIFKQIDPPDDSKVFGIKPMNSMRSSFRLSPLDKSSVEHHIDLMYPPNP